jgi:hypothetical protein
MDIEMNEGLEAVGKALSKKNLNKMKACVAAHKEAIALHQKAVDDMEAMIAEHESAEAGAVIRITK